MSVLTCVVRLPFCKQVIGHHVFGYYVSNHAQPILHVSVSLPVYKDFLKGIVIGLHSCSPAP